MYFKRRDVDGVTIVDLVLFSAKQNSAFTAHDDDGVIVRVAIKACIPPGRHLKIPDGKVVGAITLADHFTFRGIANVSLAGYPFPIEAAIFALEFVNNTQRFTFINFDKRPASLAIRRL